MWRPLFAAGTCALLGCGSALPSPSPGRFDEIRSIRLFDGAGVDRTNHVFLFLSDTLHLEVRAYADDGRFLIEIIGGVEMTFTFDPPTIATSAPVPNVELVRSVTTAASSGTIGNLTVSLRFLADGSERSFGPFECLVH